MKSIPRQESGFSSPDTYYKLNKSINSIVLVQINLPLSKVDSIKWK